MAELAEIYALHPTTVMMAGLLHDAAKDLSFAQQLALAEEANLSFTYPCERHPVYLHAAVGAYLVAKELRITDELILDAISTHSLNGTGDRFDRVFSWCLRFADILAPIQEWRGMKKFRRIVYAGRRDEAALLHCGWLIEYFQEVGIPIHPSIRQNYQVLLTKLEVDETFFERW